MINFGSEENKISEVWKVKLNLKENNSAYSVLTAEGELQQGTSAAKFSNADVYIKYQTKNFLLTHKDSNQFAMTLNSIGELSSSTEKIDFNHQITSEGEINSESWDLASLKHVLNIPDRSQAFEITSNAMELTWLSDHCAEPVGVAQALEVGRNPGQIFLNRKEATLVGKSWKQVFKGCAEQSLLSLNFEFLFF